MFMFLTSPLECSPLPIFAAVLFDNAGQNTPNWEALNSILFQKKLTIRGEFSSTLDGAKEARHSCAPIEDSGYSC